MGKQIYLYLGLCVLCMMGATQVALASEPGSAHHVFDLTGPKSSPLLMPTDLVVTTDYIVVVDSGNDRLAFFSKSGNFLNEVGGSGDAPGLFNGPVGIGADDSGHLFVADSRNHRLQILDSKGQFKLQIPVIDEGTPVRPVDVAVDSRAGLLFVTGNDNHKVMVYGTNGALVNSWGGNGEEKGEFRYPATITMLSDDRVAVVDVLNTRLQVFKRSGQFSIQIGDWGVLPGQLFRPKGVAVDDAQNVYISDSYMNVIQVFSDEGRFLRVLSISGPDRPLETPVGMFISEGFLYVAEMMANRVSVYRLAD